MSEINILTPMQSDVLNTLFADAWFRQHFYLTGGTALAAFHLHHRYSDDLDFFTHAVDLAPIPPLLRYAADVLKLPLKEIRHSRDFLRYQLRDELMLDFVVDVPFRVGTPMLVRDFMIDTIPNIAVNKVCAILGRLDAKDYIDLYTIFEDHPQDLFELLTLGRQKDAGLDPFIWASLIADVGQLHVMPRMIRPVARDTLIRFYLDLRDMILDRLRPAKR